MRLQDKHRKEIGRQKNARIQLVLQAARRIFLKEGISKTPMSVVAREAEVGIASLYRYFKTKQELVIRVAEELMQEEFQKYSQEFKTSLKNSRSGLEEVENIFRLYILLFDREKELLRFIEEFDNYIAQEKIEPDLLSGYAQVFRSIEKSFFEACKRGEKEGSIRGNLPLEEIFISYSKALMGLAQKHVSRGILLPSDRGNDGRKELLRLLDIVLYYLKSSD